MNRIRHFIKEVFLNKQIRKERHYEEGLELKNYPKSTAIPLTLDEKEAVYSMWGKITNEISMKEFEHFKFFYGFDARFLTHDLYLPLVARLLNDYNITKFFENKSLLGYLKNEGILFPDVYCRLIEGEFYDGNMKQISLKQSVAECAKNEDLIIKPSKNSSGGKGIKILRRGDLNKDLWEKCIEEELASRRNDYVAQSLVKQNSVMAMLNPTSVNTIRLYTLYLNGVVSSHAVIVRIGKKGSLVDNIGQGGVGVGVHDDGRLFDYGFTPQHDKVYDINGVTFSNYIIPMIPKVIETIKLAHVNNFSLCKFIGWDVAINESGDPVIIEINSSQPGVNFEQLFYGPMFGERTEEVIEYCSKKHFTYNKSIFKL